MRSSRRDSRRQPERRARPEPSRRIPVQPGGPVRRPPAGGSAPGTERVCTRAGCTEPAAGTLTYVYAESTAVLGPLAGYPEPHTYDLCQTHARGLTAPRGWRLVRHDGELAPPPPPPDDLAALADAVREPGPPPVAGRPDVPHPDDPLGRRGLLRLVRPD